MIQPNLLLRFMGNRSLQNIHDFEYEISVMKMRVMVEKVFV